ncbi:MAG: AhpC/TSA family protein [Coleofasciculaceae cyanobacterium SM2_1_6]|nr:AhpC/TSA family protein [Coleofasciculaceae cyanobacterium SM2_1_6]
MNLPEELRKIALEQSQNFPPEQLAQINQEIENLRLSGLIQKSLQVNDQSPDFTLVNAATEELVQLEQVRQTGAVVLSFFRGAWCPYCSLELIAMEEILPTILNLKATLLSISPEISRRSRAAAREKNFSHPILVDNGNQVARQFGIVHQVEKVLREIYHNFGVSLPLFNGDETYELPVPATFIIDRQGVIAYRFVDPDYTKRVDPVEIITVLRQLKDNQV